MGAFGCSFISVFPNITLFNKKNSQSSKSFINQANWSSKDTKILNMAKNTVVRQQKITLRNQHNEKLVGVLHETGSADVVVLCHGFRSSKDSKIMKNVSVALENEGISSFRFDFAGNGESEGSFQYGNYWREVEDTRSAVEFFTGANRRITAILGHSKGGNIVLLYSSKYHDISTVVNVSGRYKLDRGIEERLGKGFLERIKKDGYIDVQESAGAEMYRVTVESLMDRLNTNVHDACRLIDKECRVLIMHGSADEVIPVEDALEFAKVIPNHTLRIIEGADHGYNFHQSELISVVVPFIKEVQAELLLLGLLHYLLSLLALICGGI